MKTLLCGGPTLEPQTFPFEEKRGRKNRRAELRQDLYFLLVISCNFFYLFLDIKKYFDILNIYFRNL